MVVKGKLDWQARVLALTVFEEDTLCPHSASLYFDKWKKSSA